MKPAAPLETLVHPKIPLDEGASLWRYMRLSTFLALLDGYAFLPFIQKLRDTDPMEGEIACGAEWIIGELDKMDPWLCKHGSDWEREQLGKPDLV